MLKIKRILPAALTLCLGLMALGAQAQVAVVVSAKSSLANLSPEQAANVFLGRSNALPGASGTAALVDLPEGSAVREQFYSKAAGKTSAQVKAAWSRLTFSGKAMPPKELSSAADVKKFVAANPEAVGYIEKSAVDSSVKVVLVLE